MIQAHKQILVLAKGEELMATIEAYAKKHKIKSAWIQALGAASQVEIGYYHLDDQEYKWQQFDGPLEVAHLAGNISLKDGKPFLHLHGVFARDEYMTVGGHVRKLIVSATCEVFIQELEMELKRKPDQRIGLALIDED